MGALLDRGCGEDSAWRGPRANLDDDELEEWRPGRGALA